MSYVEKLRMWERVSREERVMFHSDIIKCFEQRYGDLMDEAHKGATNTVKETNEGDSLLSHICKVWRSEVSSVE